MLSVTVCHFFVVLLSVAVLHHFAQLRCVGSRIHASIIRPAQPIGAESMRVCVCMANGAFEPRAAN